MDKASESHHDFSILSAAPHRVDDSDHVVLKLESQSGGIASNEEVKFEQVPEPVKENLETWE